MPSEPDNKMDELLKAYAKKRRAEAGGELHPATRRLLQAEAAKLRPPAAADSPSWLSALRMFWPRVGFAAAVVIFGGIAVISLYPPAVVKNDEVFLAKQDSEATSQDRYLRRERDGATLRSLASAIPAPSQPADQPAGARPDAVMELSAAPRANLPPPALAVADDQRGALAEKNEALARPAAPMPMRRASVASDPMPAAPPAPKSKPVALAVTDEAAQVKDVELGKESKLKTSLAGDTQLRGATVADRKQIEELAAATVKTPATELPVAADPATGLPAQNAPEATQQLNNSAARGYFSQMPMAGRPAVTRSTTDPAVAVLSRFSVEQEGEVVRVVDGDGSVYEGKVVAVSEGAVKELEDLAASRAAVRQDDSRLRQKAAEQEVRQLQQTTTFNYQLSNSEQPRVWNFRASGTNRTLKQPVTIDAVVYNGIVVTNVANVAGVTAAGQSLNFYRTTPGQTPQQRQLGYSITASPVPASGPVALQNNLSNAQSLYLNNAVRIQGNFRVGPTNQRALDALRDGN